MISVMLTLALTTLVTEDLACLAAGVMIAQGKLSLIEGVAACVGGIFLGDLLLFAAGRWFGAPLLTWPPVARYLKPAAVERARMWLVSRGLRAVLLSRFTPGLRLPTYFAAGLLRLSPWRFSSALLLASLLWTPILVSATAHLGETYAERLLAQQSSAMLALASAGGLLYGLRQLADRRVRRRLLGAFRRVTQWEFWPAWAAYLPVAPYFLYLALRHRSLTLFTAANPGIASGGLTGESKSLILHHLSVRPDTVAEFILLREDESSARRLAQGEAFVETYPVVAKPDVGERGQGVAILRAPGELRAHLRAHTGAVILQRYVEGLEFGVFYYRYPGQAKGQILSIVSKLFPTVTGDGRQCVLDLLLADQRAVCMESAYRGLGANLDRVPALGEVVPLVEIGSHCRGAAFYDASELRTELLEAAIDDIAQRHPGFFIGRFDIRAESFAALQAGHSFRVIELNGVGAEAAHIYDPAVSIRAAYASLFRQWRIAFEIGAMNRAQGTKPMSAGDLAALLLSRSQQKTPAVASALAAMEA